MHQECVGLNAMQRNATQRTQCNATYATNAHPKTRRRRLEFQSTRLNTLENTMETLTLEMKEITTSLILNPKNSANVPFLLLQESNNARLRPNLQFDPSLVNTFGDSNRSSKMYVTTSGTSTLSRALAYGMRNKHYYTKDFPLHIILGKGSHYLTNTEDPINRARVGCSVVITGASRETSWIHGSLWIEGGPQDHVSLRSVSVVDSTTHTAITCGSGSGGASFDLRDVFIVGCVKGVYVANTTCFLEDVVMFNCRYENAYDEESGYVYVRGLCYQAEYGKLKEEEVVYRKLM
jgi:hypothetical protein